MCIYIVLKIPPPHVRETFRCFSFTNVHELTHTFYGFNWKSPSDNNLSCHRASVHLWETDSYVFMFSTFCFALKGCVFYLILDAGCEKLNARTKALSLHESGK